MSVLIFAAKCFIGAIAVILALAAVLVIAYKLEKKLYARKRNSALQKLRQLKTELDTVESFALREKIAGEKVTLAFKRVHRALNIMEQRAEFLDHTKDLRLDKPQGANWNELRSAAEELRPQLEQLRFFSQLSSITPDNWPFVESASAIYNQPAFQPRNATRRVRGAGALDYDCLPSAAERAISQSSGRVVALDAASRARKQQQQASAAYQTSARVIPFRKGGRVDIRV